MASSPVETTAKTVWSAMQRRTKRLPSSRTLYSLNDSESGNGSSRGDNDEELSLATFPRDSQPEDSMIMMTRLEQLEARFDADSKVNLQCDAFGRERYFLRVGNLQKFTRSKSQRYVFILLSNSLLWCTENTRGILSKQGELVLRNQKCTKARDRDFFIEGAHSFTCTASSRDERDEWVAAINSVLHAKHPLKTPRDVVVFQGSVTKLKKNNKLMSQYMMLYMDGNLAWGNDRPTIGKEAKIVDLIPFDKYFPPSGENTVGVLENARNRFLAVITSKKTSASLIIFATQQHRDVWLTWFKERQKGSHTRSIVLDSEPIVPPSSSPITVIEGEDDSKKSPKENVDVTTQLFQILMKGELNGIGDPLLLSVIQNEGTPTEIALLLPVLTCLIAATPFWIRGQCAPIIAAIKERASFDLEVAQAVYACYHCGFLEAHPHNSLAYATWCSDVPRRGDICTALKHMYQRPVGFEFFLENSMEAYHPFRGSRIRRVVLEKILDDNNDNNVNNAVLMTKGLIAIYCYREESEVKKRERHERKTTRIFAQGGRALSPDVLLPDSPIQDGFRTVSIVLKIGGHLRRDVAYMHISRMINMLWAQDKIVLDGRPIQISTFGAVAFTSHIGVIQYMPELILMKDVRLTFLKSEATPGRTELDLNLMCSAIGTYLACAVLGMNERTEHNVVIQPDGTVMVEDLGLRLLCDNPEVFDSIGLTQDFKAVLGENWDVFVDAFVDAFVALRKHIAPIAQFCTMMLNSVTPMNQVIDNLQSGFMMDLDVGAACVNLRKRIEKVIVSKASVKKEPTITNFASSAVAVAPTAIVVPTSPVTDKKTTTPLVTASELGQIQTVETLLNKKADPNQASEDGRTPLMMASEFGRDNVVQLLIQRKADVNQLNKDGGNALILASQAGQWEIVRLLLDAKADPKHSDKFDENPMYWANSFGESSIIALLESLGVEPI